MQTLHMMPEMPSTVIPPTSDFVFRVVILSAPPDAPVEEYQYGEDFQSASQHEHGHHDFREGTVPGEIAGRSDGAKSRPHIADACERG